MRDQLHWPGACQYESFVSRISSFTKKYGQEWNEAIDSVWESTRLRQHCCDAKGIGDVSDDEGKSRKFKRVPERGLIEWKAQVRSNADEVREVVFTWGDALE
jgi:hypothetical protein